MLVLTRKMREAIIIGDNIEVAVQEISGNRVRLGIKAPDAVVVHRAEVHQRMREFRSLDECVSNESSPAVHEQLIDVRISAGLLRHQLGQGSFEEAAETVEALMRQLMKLDLEMTDKVLDPAEKRRHHEPYEANADKSESLLGV
jgi:carbon storage regulator